MRPKDEAKHAGLAALVRLVAEIVVREAEKEAPPNLTTAKPHRERLYEQGNKAKARKDQT